MARRHRHHRRRDVDTSTAASGSISSTPVTAKIASGARDCITLIIWILKFVIFFFVAMYIFVFGLALWKWLENVQPDKERTAEDWIKLTVFLFGFSSAVMIAIAVCCERIFSLFILLLIMAAYTGVNIYFELKKEDKSTKLEWSNALKALTTTAFVTETILTCTLFLYVLLLCCCR